MKPILYIVIPCYNEENVLPITAPMFKNKLVELINKFGLSEKSKILFVNDGSIDTTWQIISSLCEKENFYCGISLSKNYGHQNALLAGLMEAKDKCDVTISIDCDGQDDLNAMNDMIKEYLCGCEIVYGVRSDRNTDTVFKRTTAQTFYKFINLMGAKTVYNHADYRLISSKALNELSKFSEVNIYLRGMVPMVGFKSTSVYYKRGNRLAGKGHYPLKKMVSLALDGITSLSIKPIRLITILGFIIVIISFIGVIWSVITKILGKSVAGWSSIVSIICMLGGIQILSIGVIGEYIGKIYLETKKRPRYIIEDRTDFSS